MEEVLCAGLVIALGTRYHEVDSKIHKMGLHLWIAINSTPVEYDADSLSELSIFTLQDRGQLA